MTAATTERAAWLQRRRRGIGASDVPGILGLSAYSSPYSIWASKVVDLPDSDDDDSDREFGRRAEQMILDWFADKTDLRVGSRGLEVEHPDHPEFICSLDGLVYETFPYDHRHLMGLADAIAVAEAKSTRDPVGAWDAAIPIAYRCQTQWQLWVTGLDVAYVPTLHRFSGQFRLYTVRRDEADIEYIVREVTDFWTSHVLTGIAPPVDDHRATTAAVKARYSTPAPDDEVVEADDDARTLVARLNAHKATLKMVESNLTRAENELRDLLGARTVLADGVDDRGRPKVLATWKPQPDNRFDTTRFRLAYPDLAREFTNEGTKRVLLPKKPKDPT